MLSALLAACMLCACEGGQAPPSETGDSAELQKYTNLSVDAGFDTVFQITEYGYDHEEMEQRFRKSTDMFSYYNNLFDIYNDYEGLNSLKTVNDNAGIAPVEVSPEIIAMLTEARSFYELSGGAFDVTIGSLLKVWHTYREEGIRLNAEGTDAPVPGEEELKEAAAVSGWEYVEIDEENNTVFITKEGVSLDVGGIAKGYAAEKIGQFMEKDGTLFAAVNAGRNIRTVNGKNDGKPWVIGITSPEDGSAYCTVEMEGSGSFVTSGDYERYYIGADGNAYHHIIDPATLKPAAYYHSVSIITPDSSAADCLSTTLFTLSIEDGRKVLEAYREETGNPCEAVWIMDPDKTQEEEGRLSGSYYCVFTEGIADRITFAR